MAVRVLSLSNLFGNNIKTTYLSKIVITRGIKRQQKKFLFQVNKRQKEYYNNMTQEERNELFRRSNFFEWNYSSEIFAFGKRLNEEFLPELLVQAFTHRSYLLKEEERLKELGLEKSSDMKDNETLALEGEKIISSYVPRYVSLFYPRFPLEGIQSIQQYLLSDEVLSHISKNLGTTFLILSADYPVETHTYAKTFKALVGALNKSKGLERANLFVRDFVLTQLAGKDVNDFLNISNYLEVLTEILNRDGKEPPEPRIIGQAATKTILASYHVGIYSNKQLIGHFFGESIDIAIEMAAFDALRKLFHTTDSCSPISYNIEQVPENVKNLKLSEWNSAAF